MLKKISRLILVTVLLPFIYVYYLRENHFDHGSRYPTTILWELANEYRNYIRIDFLHKDYIDTSIERNTYNTKKVLRKGGIPYEAYKMLKGDFYSMRVKGNELRWSGYDSDYFELTFSKDGEITLTLWAGDWRDTVRLYEEPCVTWQEAVRIIQDVFNKGDN